MPLKAKQGDPTIRPSPFFLRDSRTIPPRQWVYGNHLIRGFVSATIASGGIGKSTLIVADAIAIATGRDLMRSRPHGRAKVWIWNGEDPAEELERRVAATCLRYDVAREDIDGQLF